MSNSKKEKNKEERKILLGENKSFVDRSLPRDCHTADPGFHKSLQSSSAIIVGNCFNKKKE